MEHRNDFDNRPRHHHSPGTSKIAIGIVLIALGSILVIDRTGIFDDFKPFERFLDAFFSWQMLLIAIGFVMTLGNSNKSPGLVVMAVGGFFLIPVLFKNNPFSDYNLFWPALFIIAGIIILTNARWFKSDRWKSRETATADEIDITHIFGGGERIVTSENFSGGKITAIFGGSEIDFTRARLAPGMNEVEVTFIFGGGSLIVPSDWNVILDVTPILGGFSDSRKMVPSNPIDVSKTLVIKGTVIFGGGEIKSY